MADQATNKEAVAEPKKNYNGERKFFSANELDKLQEFAKLIAADNLPIISFEGDWPTGAGASVLPLTKRENIGTTDEKETKLYAAVIWPAYSLENILEAKEGPEKVREIVFAYQAQSILNPFRRQDFTKLGDLDTSGVPKSLQEMLEGMGADRGIYKGFNEVIKELLPTLRDKNPLFKMLTPATIRGCFASKAMALAIAPSLEAKGFWLQLLGVIENKAAKAGHNVEVFSTWKTTRDSATLDMSVDDDILAGL